jgi:hypothetical protein
LLLAWLVDIKVILGIAYWKIVKRFLISKRNNKSFARDPKYHGKSKHIGIKNHFIQDIIVYG